MVRDSREKKDELSEYSLARQPIFDRTLRVVGQELLFRSDAKADSADESGDRATSEVILRAFTEIGIEEVAGDGEVYVNTTRGFLVGEYPFPSAPDRVVLEVLETIEPTPETLEGIRARREEGFAIALDDFVLSTRSRPLLGLADIVKVDVLATSPTAQASVVAELRSLGIRPLAEKIETSRDFVRLRRLGFELFQGYFYARPEILRGRTLDPSQAASLDLLVRLYDEGVDARGLAGILRRDVALSYRLLKYVNAALFTRRVPIASIEQAVVFAGLERLRTWAALLVLAQETGMNEGLLETAYIRALLCEEIARAKGMADPPAHFLVGLFSLLDRLLGIPMGEIVRALSLDREIAQALRDHEGPKGQVLTLAIARDEGTPGARGPGQHEVSIPVERHVALVAKASGEVRACRKIVD